MSEAVEWWVFRFLYGYLPYACSSVLTKPILDGEVACPLVRGGGSRPLGRSRPPPPKPMPGVHRPDAVGRHAGE